jgi:hypothetical protein
MRYQDFASTADASVIAAYLMLKIWSAVCETCPVDAQLAARRPWKSSHADNHSSALKSWYSSKPVLKAAGSNALSMRTEVQPTSFCECVALSGHIVNADALGGTRPETGFLPKGISGPLQVAIQGSPCPEYEDWTKSLLLVTLSHRGFSSRCLAYSLPSGRYLVLSA